MTKPDFSLSYVEREALLPHYGNKETVSQRNTGRRKKTNILSPAAADRLSLTAETYSSNGALRASLPVSALDGRAFCEMSNSCWQLDKHERRRGQGAHCSYKVS